MKNPLKEEVLLKGDSKYRSFFTPLIKDCLLCVIGVNMPTLKRLAKEYSLEYVKDFYDSEIFELRYLFFASNLLNLNTHYPKPLSPVRALLTRFFIRLYSILILLG